MILINYNLSLKYIKYNYIKKYFKTIKIKINNFLIEDVEWKRVKINV